MADAVSESARPWDALFTRLRDAAGKRGGDATESTLCSTVYHDPVRYQAEQERLFRRLPLCLGHADQLREPGSVLAHEIAGVPLLAMRDAAGNIGVFRNACRHRGARLVGDNGTVCARSSLTCPYHGWTYGTDGALVTLPRREAFPTLDRAARGLQRIPATVHHGLLWAVLDPAATAPPDMACYLDQLDPELESVGMGRHRFFRQNAVRRAANWKLMVDAFLEVYHVKRLHAATIGPFFSDSVAVSDSAGPHQRLLAGRENVAELRELPLEELTPGVHGTLVHLIFPNSIIVYHPDYISHIGMFPTAPDETLFVHSMLVPEDPATEKARLHWDRSFDLIDRQVFNAEDLVICEQIQRGFAAGYADDFVLGGLEGCVRRFHETIADALRA